MSRLRMSCTLLCICVVLLVVSPSWGQGLKARLVGRVTDNSGAVIPNATVVATNVETQIQSRTSTTAEGEYVIPELSPGNYKVAVEAQAFQTYIREGITLNADTTVRVDAALRVGAVSDQVTVTEQVPVINTENATLGKTIGNQEIVDIPLNGRNYISLAQFSPGVAPAAAGANPNVINGARPDHVSYLLDGFSNVGKRGNDPVVTPSLDAIREFTLLRNDFSAAYGRLGAGVISVALKSGTNRLHGSAYEFLRNDAFDARNYFATRNPKLRQNQFGGTLGGPIIKNKTFFFFSYEGARVRNEQTKLTAVPTDDQRTGLFSTPVLNPYTKTTYPGNQVTNISPVSAKLLDFIPHANQSGVFNYVAMDSAQNDSDNILIKIDHQVSANDRLSGHYIVNRSNGTSPFSGSTLPGFGSNLHHLQQQAALDFTSSFTASIVNDARVAFSRHNFHELSVNYGKNTSADYGIAGVAARTGLAQISLAGMLGFGDANNLPDLWTDNEYSLNDTLNIVHGTHYIQIGGDYQRSQHFNHYDAYSNGLFLFNGTFTRNVFADFLIGVPIATERQVGTNTSYLFSNYAGAYVQDDWKVRPSLTLNLGLRWDYNPPPAEKYGHWGNFIPSVGKTVVAGTPGYAYAVLQTHYRNFSPRVGFAYRLPDNKTVLRGGYGIFTAFDLQYTQYQLLAATQYPFANLQLFQAPNGSLSYANPFPTVGGTAPGASTPSGWDYDNPTTYNQQWNFTIARDLGHNLGLEVGYVGTKGTHLSALANIDQPIRSASGTVLPYPSYSRIYFVHLGANSTYNALQISLEKRFSGGLSFRSNFTWSKSIDNASYVAAQTIALDPNNLRGERGLGANNRGRIWSNDFVYKLPFGRGHRIGSGWNRAADLLIGGWQMNGAMRFMDGLPFTPLVAGANQLQGYSPRPDRVGSGVLEHPTVQKWFDTSAFLPVPNTAYRYGNSGRNILIGPGYIGVDGSIFKEFALHKEGHFLQLRGEFFNLLNHANFGQPNPYIDQPTGGVINSAGDARQIQIALRYYF